MERQTERRMKRRTELLIMELFTGSAVPSEDRRESTCKAIFAVPHAIPPVWLTLRVAIEALVEAKVQVKSGQK